MPFLKESDINQFAFPSPLASGYKLIFTTPFRAMSLS